MDFQLYIFIALASLCTAMEYSDLLSKSLSDNLTLSSSQGEFTFHLSEEAGITKRDEIMTTEVYNMFANLPDLHFYSYDNCKVLEKLKIAATEACTLENFGDFFYFWDVMLHNGHPFEVNLNGSLASEVAKRIPNLPLIHETLANTSTSASLAGKYLITRPLNSAKTVFKRDTTICSDSNWPKIADCRQLMFDIRRGLSHRYDIAKCYYTCCASWSERVFLSTAWAKEKVQWCQESCVFNGYSCKITGMNVLGKKLNFCTSSISKCD